MFFSVSCCCKARDIKNKLLFLKHAINTGGNEILNEVAKNDIEKKITKWAKTTNTYMELLNLDINTLKTIKKGSIENKVNQWDTNDWRTKMQQKQTLILYASIKEKPKETLWFRNGFKYSLMMQARSDTLKIGWREFTGDKSCKLCGAEIETLYHFLIECHMLQHLRDKHLFLQLPRTQNSDEVIKTVLLFGEIDGISTDSMLRLLLDLWMERSKIMHTYNIN